MKFQQDECYEFHNKCMDTVHAVDCGIPLLNISVHCQIDNSTEVNLLIEITF